MKKILIGAAFAASALIAAMPAQASSIIACQSGPGTCTISLDDGNTAISFGGSVAQGQATVVPFTDIYEFNLGAGTATFSITSTTTGPENDLDFTLISVDQQGGPNDFALPVTGVDPIESRGGQFAVTGGTYRLNISGAAGGPGFVNGSYGGSISFTPTPSVPEPATWAMMIGGFGLVGGAMRRGRKTKVVTA